MYDLSPSFYASKTFLDTSPASAPRRILWGWLVMFAPYPPAKWQGVQAVPRVVTYVEGQGALLPTLATYPIPALARLRTNHSGVSRMAVPANTTLLYDQVDNARFLDVVVRFDPPVPNDETCGVRVQWENDTEFTDVLVPRGTVDLRILVDSFVVEVFYDHGRSVRTTLKPLNGGGRNKLAFFNKGNGSTGGDCIFTRVDVWNMQPMGFEAYESVRV